MNASAIQAHLQRSYEEGLFTDVALTFGSRVWRVHRMVLTLSGYFRASLSSAWCGGGDKRATGAAGSTASDALSTAPRTPAVSALGELEIDLTPEGHGDSDWITEESVDTVVRFLYGISPHITSRNVRALLMTASFFDVPPLCTQVGDFVFNTLRLDNVVGYANMVHAHEFGDAGKLIEDASFAFIYRNAIDVGASLHQLPLSYQRRILIAPELFTVSEFQRYKLALQLKRAMQAKVRSDMAAAGVPMASTHLLTREQPFSRIMTSAAARLSVDTTIEGSQASMHSPHTVSPPVWTTSAGSSHLSDAEMFTPTLSPRVGPAAAAEGPAGSIINTAAARSSVSSTSSAAQHQGSSTQHISAFNVLTQRGAIAHAPSVAFDACDTRLPSSPTPEAGSDYAMDEDVTATHAVVASGSGRGGGPAARDFASEMRDIDAAFDDVFRSIRVMHCTEEQCAEMRMDGEMQDDVLAAAAQERALMMSKLQVANQYNVRRLTDLTSVASTTPSVERVLGITWPSFRFGVEVSNVFKESNAPSLDRESITVCSDRVFFAGSQWCLDLKRYINRDDNVEYVAVYLRRRSVQTAALVNGNAVPFEDVRDRTTIAFSIRLCGSPGAPTTNSVCGRSVMGKAFGTESETSWGWETYISTKHLTERPWSLGDTLRFVVTLDML